MPIKLYKIIILFEKCHYHSLSISYNNSGRTSFYVLSSKENILNSFYLGYFIPYWIMCLFINSCALMWFSMAFCDQPFSKVFMSPKNTASWSQFPIKYNGWFFKVHWLVIVNLCISVVAWKSGKKAFPLWQHSLC